MVVIRHCTCIFNFIIMTPPNLSLQFNVSLRNLLKKAITMLRGLLLVLLCLAVGFISSMYQTVALVDWYPYLAKSALSPAPMVFPIVWCILYILIGISAALAMSPKIPVTREKKRTIRLFWIQLALNFLWSILFFYFMSPVWALIDIIFLDLVVVLYFMTAFKVHKWAAFLYIPYLLWLALATYLNIFIVMFN